MIPETTIALIIIFGTLVVAHEWGHFAAARLVGIRVEEFALGFGPKIAVLFKRGDTEYTIHPVPIGGFCKLAGMEPGQDDIPDGYQAQVAWKRVLVIVAGPFMSFVLAVVLFLAVGVFWGFSDVGQPKNRVGLVSPQTEAKRIGLRAGDTIVGVDGKSVAGGIDVIDYIHSRPGRKIELKIDRNGRELVKRGTPQWMFYWNGGEWSFMKRNTGLVKAVSKSAEKAGLKEGDVLEAIDGMRIRGGREMEAALKASDGRTVVMDLRRGKRLVQVTLKPELRWLKFGGATWWFPGAYIESSDAEISPHSAVGKAGLKTGYVITAIDGKKVKSLTGERLLELVRTSQGAVVLGLQREKDEPPTRLNVTRDDLSGVESGYYVAHGVLGFTPDFVLVKKGFVDSVSAGVGEFSEIVSMIMGRLLSKKFAEDLGGPLMIAKVTQTSVALGLPAVVRMAGLLSLSLALINLLPIPLLDGGHVAIIAVESLRRKRLTAQQMQNVMGAGIMIIIAIALLVLWSDIAKIAGGHVPQ